MKKVCLVIWILAYVISFAQVPIPELKNWANDFTNSLNEDELTYLNRDLSTFNDTTSNQIVFLMISTLDGYPIESFTYETAAKNKIGTAKNSNGILFLVVKNDKTMRIEVGYGLEGALPDALCSSILRNEVRPYFRQNDYFQGIKAGIDAIKSATKGEYTASSKKLSSKNIKGIATFIIIIAFLIFSFISRIGRGGRGGGFTIFPGGGGFGGLGGGSGFGGFGSGGGGFGGFSGGGGSFGGGGSSGSW
jgi:uncharacterized protein